MILLRSWNIMIRFLVVGATAVTMAFPALTAQNTSTHPREFIGWVGTGADSS
jgi:hypothetical protein